MTRTLSLASLSLALAVAACSGEDTKTKPPPAAEPTPAAVAPAPADPTASWQETRAQGFVVRGPHAGRAEPQNVPTPAGNVPATLYTDFVPSDANGALQIMVAEVPAAIASQLDPAKMMSGMLDGAANAVPGGKIVARHEISAGANHGTELVITGHHPDVGGFKARMRFFLVANRIYQVQAIYADSDPSFSALADGFVDSFAFSG
jgi:hypothetical protein